MASVESAGDKSIEVLLEEQVAYYRARASEYDDWFLRRGRYDRGVVRNLRWFEQVEQVRARLASAQAELPENVRVLELACGTGLWTTFHWSASSSSGASSPKRWSPRVESSSSTISITKSGPQWDTTWTPRKLCA